MSRSSSDAQGGQVAHSGQDWAAGFRKGSSAECSPPPVKNQLLDATREQEGGVLFWKGPAVMGTSGSWPDPLESAAGRRLCTFRAGSPEPSGTLSFSCHGPEDLVSPASGALPSCRIPVVTQRCLTGGGSTG